VSERGEREHRAGDVIDGRYTLVAPLGKGSYGLVWSARDREGEPVAIKLLYAKHKAHRKKLQRFQQEAKILARLRHPNIARLIDSNVECEDAYLAMELIEGDQLHARLDALAASGKKLPLEGAAWIGEQLAAALDEAHRKHVVHRDLKPKNVMVNRPNTAPFVKVLDFGIAKMLLGSQVDPTTVGRVLGSLLYVAPEQLLSRPLDHRVDVFALGSILFELVTMKRAWARDRQGRPLPWKYGAGDEEINSHIAIAKRIAYEPRPRASQERSGVPKAVDRVFERALAIEAADRHDSCLALVAAFRDALHDRM
jgi:serine/threonine-protein kinase